MGLDIYVRWGEEEIGADGEPIWFGDLYPDAYRDQLTGFTSAPWAGYLCESWSSLEWVKDIASKFNGPNPYLFFPDWSSWNGEAMDLTDSEQLAIVLRFRDDTIRPWCREHKYLPRDSKWTDDDRKEYTAYMSRLYDVWSFINFVEIKKDIPRLKIVFWMTMQATD